MSKSEKYYRKITYLTQTSIYHSQCLSSTLFIASVMVVINRTREDRCGVWTNVKLTCPHLSLRVLFIILTNKCLLYSQVRCYRFEIWQSECKLYLRNCLPSALSRPSVSPSVTFRYVFLRATALYAIARICYRPSVRPSVRVSVCLSHGWISQKRLKLGSCNFHHQVAPWL